MSDHGSSPRGYHSDCPVCNECSSCVDLDSRLSDALARVERAEADVSRLQGMMLDKTNFVTPIIQERDRLAAEVNRLVYELDKSRSSQVARDAELREQLDAARGENARLVEALKTAQYDLERIRDADWEAEQMRLGAQSGAFMVRQALRACPNDVETLNAQLLAERGRG